MGKATRRRQANAQPSTAGQAIAGKKKEEAAATEAEVAAAAEEDTAIRRRYQYLSFQCVGAVAMLFFAWQVPCLVLIRARGAGQPNGRRAARPHARTRTFDVLPASLSTANFLLS